MVVVTFLAPSALFKWSTYSGKSSNKCDARKFAISEKYFNDVLGPVLRRVKLRFYSCVQSWLNMKSFIKSWGPCEHWLTAAGQNCHVPGLPRGICLLRVMPWPDRLIPGKSEVSPDGDYQRRSPNGVMQCMSMQSMRMVRAVSCLKSFALGTCTLPRLQRSTICFPICLTEEQSFLCYHTGPVLFC